MKLAQMDIYFQNNECLLNTKNTLRIGAWAIELDPEQPPRMYGDIVMRTLLNVPDDITPEECYMVWYSHIFSSHLHVVEYAIQELITGKQTEITYPWMNVQGQLTYVRCGGQRDNSYTKGIRFCGYHQDVTNIVLEEKQKNKEVVISDYLLQVLASPYDSIHFVDFRTYKISAIKTNFPEKWTDGEIPLHTYGEVLELYIEPKQTEWILNCIQQQCMYDKNGAEIFYEERESRITRNGVDYWYSIVMCLDQSDANMSMILAFRNISENKRVHSIIEQLRTKSELDGLTKLFNRITMETKIEEYLKNPIQQSAFLLLDLDNFKPVNDYLGHIEGDVLLMELSEKLKKLCQDKGDVGRLGGDEFLVFLNDMTKQSVLDLATQMLQTVTKTYQTDEISFTVTASIGIAYCQESGATFSQLYQRADKALYYAKEHGKARYALYVSEEEFLT